MKRVNCYSVFLALIIAYHLSGCMAKSSDQLLKMNGSQVAARSIQSRAFDTQDKNNLLRSIIATLQDLGFVIDKADDVLGTVSATKLDGYQLRITVSVRPRGPEQLLVRANAQYNLDAVDDPHIYQDFFHALEKSLFLSAHAVD